MLSFNEFDSLWQKDFASFLPNQNIAPIFKSYLIRENHLEDFLDIYRGKDTRAKRGIDDGSVHRFANLFTLKYKIQYILVAEAAPVGNSYIYDNASGLYITAPLGAFNIKNTRNLCPDKRLSSLAASGILVLDLLPFNLAFKEKNGYLRNRLIEKGTTWKYLADPNNRYSIINRVNNLIDTIPNLNLNKTVNAAFMATPLINKYLSEKITHTDLNPLIFQSGLNKMDNQQICNSLGNSYPLGNLKAVPKFSAEGCAASGSPHATLIKNALNL